MCKLKHILHTDIVNEKAYNVYAHLNKIIHRNRHWFRVSGHAHRSP